ncbi:MAG: serine/threonine-protein phosphatase [Bacteroidales bacterium]|nr:serine/threonine-protein phosphatase [Bacteroidales bacterium]
MNLADNIQTKKLLQLSAENFERQQNELIESLKYASYIQQVLLPSDADFRRHFAEHFIYHQPRDIVSGDFYYISYTRESVAIAVADCTGHGVPGAFMSILGITFLNEIFHNFAGLSAGSMLNLLREYIMKALCQTGEDDEQKDGLDMALCIINKETGSLNFSGAFNPLYIVRDHELTELQGDKMPVGIAPEEEKSFTTQHFELMDHDLIYLFTDGFADQFGGPSGRKFKYQPFRDLITDISSLPIQQQKHRLLDTFNDWKGNLKQLDDVLIVGCRYKDK